MVKVNVLLTDCKALSFAVTVNVLATRVVSVFPKIYPLAVLNVNPVGKLGLILYVNVP